MCGPALPIIATVASVAGTGLQVYGSMKRGEAEEEAYRAQAAENERLALETLQEGELMVGRVREGETRDIKNLKRDSAQLQGAQRTSMAGNGVWGGSGTAADVIADTVTRQARDEETIRYNADIKAADYSRGVQQKAAALRAGASSARAAAGNAGTAGGINAAAGLLDGASRVSDVWLKYGDRKVS